MGSETDGQALQKFPKVSIFCTKYTNYQDWCMESAEMFFFSGFKLTYVWRELICKNKAGEHKRQIYTGLSQDTTNVDPTPDEKCSYAQDQTFYLPCTSQCFQKDTLYLAPYEILHALVGCDTKTDFQESADDGTIKVPPPLAAVSNRHTIKVQKIVVTGSPLCNSGV